MHIECALLFKLNINEYCTFIDNSSHKNALPAALGHILQN